MKKLFFLILALLLLCACGVEEAIDKNPQSKPEVSEVAEENENELGEGSSVLEDSVFKTADGKYGIQKDGKIVFEPVYDVFKTVGEIGERTVYALGKTEGTMPAIAYDDDSRAIGIGEKERILFEFF